MSWNLWLSARFVPPTIATRPTPRSPSTKPLAISVSAGIQNPASSLASIPARISLPSPPYPHLATISSENPFFLSIPYSHKIKMTCLFSMNCRAALMKNSDEVVVAWGEQVGYQSASNSVILNLEKGDRVYLNIREGEIYETSKVGSHGYTSFSGFRVY